MGAFSADGILSSAFGIVNEKDDDFLWTMHADGERHFDIGGSGGTCDQHRVGRVTRPCQRFGQIRDEEAGRQNDEVGFGQERDLERLAFVEQEHRPCIGDACRATCQPDFDGGIRFADGGKFGWEILRAERVHEDLSRFALTEEAGQRFPKFFLRAGDDRPAEGYQFGGELGLVIGKW